MIGLILFFFFFVYYLIPKFLYLFLDIYLFVVLNRSRIIVRTFFQNNEEKKEKFYLNVRQKKKRFLEIFDRPSTN